MEMQIAKGIEGIRTFKATKMNTKHWHLFVGETYYGFGGEKTTREIFTQLDMDFNEGLEFAGPVGNGLYFNIK